MLPSGAAEFQTPTASSTFDGHLENDNLCSNIHAQIQEFMTISAMSRFISRGLLRQCLCEWRSSRNADWFSARHVEHDQTQQDTKRRKKRRKDGTTQLMEDRRRRKSQKKTESDKRRRSRQKKTKRVGKPEEDKTRQKRQKKTKEGRKQQKKTENTEEDKRR